MFTTTDLPPGVTDNFTHVCKRCGRTLTVVAGVEVPHRCSISVGTPVIT